MSSFAQQYGIRLYQEYDSISCEEFRQLLIGLNGDTALGQVIRIRSEKDNKKISQMTNQEKKIRSDWLKFKSKQNKNNKQMIQLSANEINSVLSNLFR